MTGFTSKRQAALDKAMTRPIESDIYKRHWDIASCKAYAEQLRDKNRANTAEHAAEAIEYLLALAQPEQEPVAWGFRHHDGAIYDCISPEAHADCEGEYNVPLYDAPPKRTWVGLTDEDTFKIGERLGLADVAWIDLMKAIEAALRSKNT